MQSLSHPGGNVTGLTNFAEDLASKQLDIIRELLPRLMRIGALVNVENPLHAPQWQEMQAAASKAALALVHFDCRVPEPGNNVSDPSRHFGQRLMLQQRSRIQPYQSSDLSRYDAVT